jgi:predicted NAD/FAD-binding protein
MKPIVVVGAGPAGIAASCALVDRGNPVMLLERAARLGGRAASFHFARMDEEIDDGQHVLLGACTRTVELLKRIGQSHALAFQPVMRVPIVWPGGGSILRSAPLPGSLHLLPSLLSYAALPLAARLAALRLGPALERGRLPDDVSFSTWLSSHGQSRRSLAALWEPIVRATLNGRCD